MTISIGLSRRKLARIISSSGKGIACKARYRLSLIATRHAGRCPRTPHPDDVLRHLVNLPVHACRLLVIDLHPIDAAKRFAGRIPVKTSGNVM
jgi:hypothetical protein